MFVEFFLQLFLESEILICKALKHAWKASNFDHFPFCSWFLKVKSMNDYHKQIQIKQPYLK